MNTWTLSIARRVWPFAVLGACAVLMEGCAAVGADVAYSSTMRPRMVNADRLTPEEFRQVEQVRWITANDDHAYTGKGRVVGLACKLSAGPLIPVFHWAPRPSDRNGASPEEIAKTQLRIAAMRKGANGVLSPSCTHNDGIDWASNCFESWVCVGEAVSLD